MSKKFTVGDIRKAIEGLSNEVIVELTQGGMSALVEAAWSCGVHDDAPDWSIDLSRLSYHHGRFYVEVEIETTESNEDDEDDCGDDPDWSKDEDYPD